jgi:hypothetical protein
MTCALKGRLAVIAFFGLAACAELPKPPVAPPPPPQAQAPRGDVIPTTPIDLGPYAMGQQQAVAGRFQREITGRYPLNVALGTVAADLRKNAFICFAAAQGGGDPPRQVCRKSVKIAECEHTFQVHLYDAAGNLKLARTRALYDRVCGGDGLLGAPTS